MGDGPSPASGPEQGISLQGGEDAPWGWEGRQRKGSRPEIFHHPSLLSSLWGGGSSWCSSGATCASSAQPGGLSWPHSQDQPGALLDQRAPQPAGHLQSWGLPITLPHSVWGTPSPSLPWSHVRRIYPEQEDRFTKTWPSLSCFD